MNSLGCLYLFHQAPWNQGQKHVKMSPETFHEVVKASPAHICRRKHQNNDNRDYIKTHQLLNFYTYIDVIIITLSGITCE